MRRLAALWAELAQDDGRGDATEYVRELEGPTMPERTPAEWVPNVHVCRECKDAAWRDVQAEIVTLRAQLADARRFATKVAHGIDYEAPILREQVRAEVAERERDALRLRVAALDAERLVVAEYLRDTDADFRARRPSERPILEALLSLAAPAPAPGGEEARPCNFCGGSGRVDGRHDFADAEIEGPCPRCEGRGAICVGATLPPVRQRCPACKGAGTVMVTRDPLVDGCGAPESIPCPDCAPPEAGGETR